jgi:hypothetical protein
MQEHPAIFLPVEYTIVNFDRLRQYIHALWPKARFIIENPLDSDGSDGVDCGICWDDPTTGIQYRWAHRFFAVARDIYTETVRHPAYDHDKDMAWFAWMDDGMLRCIAPPCEVEFLKAIVNFEGYVPLSGHAFNLLIKTVRPL